MSVWYDENTPPTDQPAVGMLWWWNTDARNGEGMWEQKPDPSYVDPASLPPKPTQLLPAGWAYEFGPDGYWMVVDKRPPVPKTPNGVPWDSSRNPDGSYVNPPDTTPAALVPKTVATMNNPATKVITQPMPKYKPPVVKRTMPNLWQPFSIRNGNDTGTGWKRAGGKKTI